MITRRHFPLRMIFADRAYARRCTLLVLAAALLCACRAEESPSISNREYKEVSSHPDDEQTRPIYTISPDSNESGFRAEPVANSAGDQTSAPAVPPVEPSSSLGLLMQMTVEVDGDMARLKYSLELLNPSGSPVALTFLRSEFEHSLHGEEDPVKVGSGTFGVRRPLSIAPGETASIQRGDFTTIGVDSVKSGRFTHAQQRGSVVLEDDSGHEILLDYTGEFAFRLDGGELNVVDISGGA